MEKSGKYLQYFLIIIVGTLIFLPGLFSFFNSDDFVWIKNSQELNLKTISHFIINYDSVIKFRPLVHFFFQLIFGIFGLTPLCYHLMGLIFHLLNAILFYKLLLKFTSDNKLSLISSLIFVSHFAQEETLFWISAISSPMVTFLYLCCIWAIWKYLLENKISFYVLSLILAGLALLAKEDSITAFLVVFLMSYAMTTGGSRLKLKKGILLSLPFLGLSFAYSVIRYLTVPEYIMSRFLTYNPVVIIKNLCYFGISLLFPVRFLFDVIGFEVHSYLNSVVQHRLDNPWVVLVLLSISLVFVMIIISLLKRRVYGLRIGLGLILIGILPYLLVNGNGQRFLYFSSLGFSLVLASTIIDISNKIKRFNILYAFIVIILLFNGAIMYKRSIWWRKAGEICRVVLYQAGEISRSYPGGSKIYFANLPQRMNGAYTFHTGFEEAFYLFYPEALVKVYDLGQLDEKELKNFKNNLRQEINIYKGEGFIRF
ncbi:MAG: glycosyltransferase family 39 protein [candidate division Zixibacteria bacterium]|nr:glycosyltransferase family 39 protein [candidate division Zixibacteria bacterium]